MHTILYGRTSTAEQTIHHQLSQAKAAGFRLDSHVFDEGVSGVATRFAERPGGSRLLDPATGLRRGDVLVVRWVDRLGRNYEDVTDTIRELMRRGVVVRTTINALTFDGATKDPMQSAVRDALIGFMAATAQAQAEATKEAQKAGIAHARESGDGRYLGRKPTFDAEKLQRAHELLSMGTAPASIARELGLSRATVYRIKDDPTKAAAAVESWGI
jgi:putative DNA-invertase from lambdoid prophage Rac